MNLTALAIIAGAAFTGMAALLGVYLSLVKRVKGLEDANAKLVEANWDRAQEILTLNEFVDRLCSEERDPDLDDLELWCKEELQRLENKLEEHAAAEMTTEQDLEDRFNKAWQDGINGIFSYGMNIPHLDLEAIKHE